MNNQQFSELINFSRTTTGRYTNAAGLLVEAAIDAPRFDHDSVTLRPKGLLLEPARQNAFTFSQDFSNAAWVKNRTTATVGQIAPDGTATAYTLTINDASASAYLFRQNVAWTAGNIYSVSLYAKAGNQPFVYLSYLGAAFGGTNQVNFDLTGNGSFVITGAGSAGTTARIEKLANGWFRLSMSATCTVSQPAANWIVFSQPVVLGGSYIAWGAQFEIGQGATSYIPTTTVAVTRAADIAFVDPAAWLREGEGTLYTEAISYGGQRFKASLGTTAASGSRAANWESTAGVLAAQVVAPDLSTSFAASITTIGVGVLSKQAVAWRQNDFQGAANGLISFVDTSGEPPLAQRLSLGARGISTDLLNGHLRRVKYFPYRLSGDELRALTQ